MSTLDKRARWESRTTGVMLVLGAAFIVAFSILVLNPDLDSTQVAIYTAILAIAWVAFAVDFAVRFVLTPRGQRAQFVKGNIPDLLSVGFPLFRAFSVIGHLKDLPFFRQRDPGAVRLQVIVYAALYAVVFVYFLALGTYDAERNAPNATMTSFGDALWWSIVTMTTVGYGDEYPVTMLGRMYAVLLMFGGIAIVGTASALLISVINERIVAPVAAIKSKADDAA